MSSHTSMKATRDTTQNALPRPLRDRSWNELERTLFWLFAPSKVACSSRGFDLSKSPDPQRALREKLFGLNGKALQLQICAGISGNGVHTNDPKFPLASPTLLLSFSAIRS